MNPWKYTLYGALAFSVLFVGLSWCLPRHWRVVREQTMHAPIGCVFQQVQDVNHWPKWIAFSKQSDPALDIQFIAPPMKQASVILWRGVKIGEGSLSFTQLKPYQALHYTTSLLDADYQSNGVFHFETQGQNTHVTWTDTGDLGFNPFARYFGLLLDNMIGSDLGKSLEQLKTYAEERCTIQ